MDYNQDLFVSYAKPVYGQEEIDAVVKCLNESTQMGNYSRQFESKIAALFDKKHCLQVKKRVLEKSGLLEEIGVQKLIFLCNF